MYIIFILLGTGISFAKGSEIISEKNAELTTYPSQSRTSDAFPSIDCSKGEFHPHPNECGKFIHCGNGIVYVKSCPKSLHYSAEARVCDHPCRAHCDKNLAEECGWNKTDTVFPLKNLISGVCSAEKFIPNKDDCTTFFVCCLSGTFLMRCPSGLHFSPERERCLHPCEAKCDKNMDCNSLSRKSEFKCPPEDGRYGDPYDCSIYHDCSNFSHKIKRCKTEKYFDNERRQCTGRSRARCLYQCQKRKGRFPHPKECDMFIHCRNNKAVVRRCPIGRAFDATKQDCVRIERTNCRKNELIDILFSRDSIH